MAEKLNKCTIKLESCPLYSLGQRVAIHSCRYKSPYTHTHTHTHR